MEFIERQKQTFVQVIPARYSKMKPKQKQLLRLSCAALAVMLAVGTVPFLRSFAAEDGAEEAAVSGSDLVSGSDAETPADGIVTIDGGTVEPKTYNYSITDGVLTIDESGIVGQFRIYENNEITSILMNADDITFYRFAYVLCDALTSITVNGDNAIFQQYSVSKCNALTTITVNGNNAYFGRSAFRNNPNLSSVTISGSNHSFYTGTFYGSPNVNITFKCNAIQSEGGFSNLSDQNTVRVPCGFTVNGTTVTPNNASQFFNRANVIFYHGMAKTNAKAATCTEDGNIEYWTCVGCHKIFSDENGTTEITEADTVIAAPGHSLTKTAAVDATCTEDGNINYWTCDVFHKIFSDANGTTEITEADTVIAAPGHDFHDDDWATVTEPTETTPGEEEHFCHRDGCHERETRPIPARGPDNYKFTADSQSKWTKGSKDGMVVIIKNTSGDDTKTFDKLVDVYVDGAKLTRDTDYTAESGSIKLTLSSNYLKTLETGEHTLTVELTVTSLSYTFTIAAPASTDTPATGESTVASVTAVALMMLAAYGVVYAIRRRITVSAKAA